MLDRDIWLSMLEAPEQTFLFLVSSSSCRVRQAIPGASEMVTPDYWLCPKPDAGMLSGRALSFLSLGQEMDNLRLPASIEDLVRNSVSFIQPYLRMRFCPIKELLAG